MFSRLDTIPACDGRKDGRTPHNGKDPAMHFVDGLKTVSLLVSIRHLSV